jgi:hypothetical protein
VVSTQAEADEGHNTVGLLNTLTTIYGSLRIRGLLFVLGHFIDQQRAAGFFGVAVNSGNASCP